jgi:hypothetical protein
MSAPVRLEVVAGPGYWEERARIKRRIWRATKAARPRGRRPLIIPARAIADYVSGAELAAVAKRYGLSYGAFRRRLCADGLLRQRQPFHLTLEAIEAYRAGATINEVARLCQGSCTAARQALVEAGVEIRRYTSHCARQVSDITRAEEFKRRYLSGETLRSIGKDYGVSGERVRQILRKFGVESVGYRAEHLKKPRPPTEEEVEIGRLFREGVSPAEIKRRFPGFRHREILKRLGLPLPARYAWQLRPDDAELTVRVASLYQSGLSATEIVRRVPEVRFPETVYRYLKRAGVPPRQQRPSRGRPAHFDARAKAKRAEWGRG